MFLGGQHYVLACFLSIRTINYEYRVAGFSEVLRGVLYYSLHQWLFVGVVNVLFVILFLYGLMLL
jgi:hypothetical protein